MNNILEFVKIQATGNDFIVVDAQKNQTGSLTPELIRELCHRRLGIGADGFIILKKNSDNHLKMHYYNSDGFESTMCGNGLRATALFAQSFGYVQLGESFELHVVDGKHEAKVISKDHIEVQIFAHNDTRVVDEKALALPGGMKVLGWINTGVPHLVIEVESGLDSVDVHKIGHEIRNHLMFKPEGTNINFLQYKNDHTISVRTYERGVEEETLSCGTGVTASVLLWNKTASGTTRVLTRGGQLSVVTEQNSITLCGPGKIVFIGNKIIDV